MNAATAIAVAILLGGGVAGGVLLVLAALPRWRQAALIPRIAPHVRDVIDLPEASSALRPGLPLGEAWTALVAAVTRLLGSGEAAVRVRLAQAGSTRPVAWFRSVQLAAMLIGALIGAVATVALAVAGRMSAPAAVLPLLAALAAGLGADALLTMRARARAARLAEELPTVLEFFSLCLSAGEGLRDALRRVADVGSGELSGELRTVALAVATGSGLGDALAESGRRLQIPAYSRAVDQIVAALERGAPLSSVLQAQASDAREDTKRDLIERAGRKEIFMMLPLVFMLLPLSVIFAVFPGVFVLRLGIG
ncbi:type II secretion system F family protein [Microbacterium pseudoresistens]|uniref:Tight adherence protein C n=1 Tax=Microbacterium pseudoresistens TaxID=640634 RepID=A0A7Y9ES62_9MICO|nr:type II secretion system F family protein [Microbacterium pseudoresistens]NYD52967.1 tight adherence protein C [Microbacterium pseudoresistens]